MLENHESTLAEAFLSALVLYRVEPPEITCSSKVRTGPAVPIDEWQRELQKLRVASLGKPGLYLDRSDTGAGKSTADQAALRHVRRALIVLPTHEQCDELAAELQNAGIDAVPYPGRFTKGEKQNCWNAEADAAEIMGLSVGAAVCPTCDMRSVCESSGYLAMVKTAKDADVSIATHARAIHNTLAKLADGCEFIALHEDILKVLLPDESLSPEALDAARTVLDWTLNAPNWLDWFGSAFSRDDDGHLLPDERKQAARDTLFEFVRHMASVVDFAANSVTTASETIEIQLPCSKEKAQGIERLLFRATTEAKVQFGDESPWRVILCLATGDAYRTGVVIHDLETEGQSDADRSQAKSAEVECSVLAG